MISVDFYISCTFLYYNFFNPVSLYKTDKDFLKRKSHTFRYYTYPCATKTSQWQQSMSLLFSRKVVCDSLQPHGLQHPTLSCPWLSSRVCSNSCPLSQGCYFITSSSATLFSFCLQSFPASGSFPMSQLFASGGQSIGASASVSVLPMNIKSLFPLGLTGLISLQPKRLSGVFSSTTVQSINSSVLSLLYGPTLTPRLLEKP